MKDDDAGWADEEFTAWAVACAESLAARQGAAPSTAGPANPTLRQRQEQFRTCLRRLERDRLARQDSAAGTPVLHSGDRPTALPVPKELGRFRLGRVLGGGGFGVVYLAQDPRLRRQVALKVPRPEALFTPGLRQRFLREAQATARLSHPYILPVFEAGEAGPFCFLVEGYCAGGSLAAWLANRPAPLPARAAALLLAALAGAVQHAHEHGVLHRDLKPANILLEPLGDEEPGLWDGFPFRPRVGDFGLAKFLDLMEEEIPLSTERVAGPDSPSLDSVALLGTPAYMAPEQARNRRAEIGPTTDVYGLGALLYELLTGRPPIQGADVPETLRRVESEEPVPPRRLRPEVPRDLEAICLKCLAKAPARRYASVQTLAEELHCFLEGRPVQARAAGLGRRTLKWARRRPTVAGLVLVSACALLGLVLGAWEYGKRLEQHNRQLQEAYEREEGQKLLAQEREQLARQRLYGMELKAAAEALAIGKPLVAFDLLMRQRPEAGQEDLREFTWYLLREECRPLRAILRGQHEVVTAVAFAPDGRTLASGAGDGTVYLWDLDTGTVKAKLEDSSRSVMSLRFLPTGELGIDRNKKHTWEFHRWNPATGAVRLACKDSTATVNSQSALSPDGRRVAVPDLLEGVKIWDLESGSLLARLDVKLDVKTELYCYHLAFTPDGQYLVAAGTFGKTFVWDQRFHLKQYFVVPDTGPMVITALALDGKRVALAFQNQSIVIDNLFPPRAINRCYPTVTDKSWIHTLAFSPDGRTLASGNADKTGSVKLWEVPTLRKLAKFEGDSGALAFSPDGRLLAQASHMHRCIRLYDVDQTRPLSTWTGHTAEAWTLAYSPDGRTLASAGDDWKVKLWDAATATQKRILRGHEALVTNVAFSPDGRMLASASFDCKVVLWDPATGAKRTVLRGHATRVRCLAFAPDGKTLITGDIGGTIKTWDPATGAECLSIASQAGRVEGLAFAPDGQTFATAFDKHTVKFWDSRTGELRQTLQEWQGVRGLCFAPNGQTLATVSTGGMVRLWDTVTGQERTSLAGHTNEVLAVAFSPDGKTLATAGLDKTVRFWDPRSGVELLALKRHAQQINALAFAPDGQTLASADHAGEIRLWRAPRNPK